MWQRTSAKAADFDNWVMKFFTKTWKNAANVKATYLVQANDTHPSWYVTVFFWVDLSTEGYKRYPAYLTDHLLKGVCLLYRDWIGAQMFPTCFNKKQSHYREVPRWEIFMEQELRFGLDLVNFSAFIASKSFDLWNHHIPQMKWYNLWHILVYQKYMKFRKKTLFK